MKIAVVVLNWNGRELLEQFLPELVKNSSEAEVILVDNGSTDDSVEYVKKHFPKVRQIKHRENYWFAEGYNRALKKIDAEYYILINSDVEVTPNWIQPSIRLFESDSNIAAIQPKIKSYGDNKSFEYAGAAGGFIDYFGYPFCRGRIFDTVERDDGQYDDQKEIFWASGACLFIRASCFHEMQGFDGLFKAHMEEIDLCWRLKNYGYRIMYCPDSTVYHVGAATLKNSDPQKVYLNFRNNLLMLFKNIPKDRWLFMLIARFALDELAAIRFMLSGNIKAGFKVFEAYGSFIRNINHVIRYQKSIDQTKRNKVGMYKKSIVLDYFIKEKKQFSSLKF